MEQKMGRKRRANLYHGEMLTIAEIVERTGTPEYRIRSRLSRGWTLEDAADTKTVGMETWVQRHKAKTDAQAQPNADTPRLKAAHKIATEIICSSFGDFDFECLEPNLLYAFRSDILAYRIRFSSTADACTATLNAFYPEKGIWSTLNRTYAVIGSKIKEMN